MNIFKGIFVITASLFLLNSGSAFAAEDFDPLCNFGNNDLKYRCTKLLESGFFTKEAANVCLGFAPEHWRMHCLEHIRGKAYSAEAVVECEKSRMGSNRLKCIKDAGEKTDSKLAGLWPATKPVEVVSTPTTAPDDGFAYTGSVNQQVFSGK